MYILAYKFIPKSYILITSSRLDSDLDGIYQKLSNNTYKNLITNEKLSVQKDNNLNNLVISSSSNTQSFSLSGWRNCSLNPCSFTMSTNATNTDSYAAKIQGTYSIENPSEHHQYTKNDRYVCSTAGLSGAYIQYVGTYSEGNEWGYEKTGAWAVYLTEEDANPVFFVHTNSDYPPETGWIGELQSEYQSMFGSVYGGDVEVTISNSNIITDKHEFDIYIELIYNLKNYGFRIKNVVPGTEDTHSYKVVSIGNEFLGATFDNGSSTLPVSTEEFYFYENSWYFKYYNNSSSEYKIIQNLSENQTSSSIPLDNWDENLKIDLYNDVSE